METQINPSHNVIKALESEGYVLCYRDVSGKYRRLDGIKEQIAESVINESTPTSELCKALENLVAGVRSAWDEHDGVSPSLVNAAEEVLKKASKE